MEKEEEILPWSPRDVILFKDNGCEVDACQLGNAFGPDFYSSLPRLSWPRNLRADGSATLLRFLRPIHVTSRKGKKGERRPLPSALRACACKYLRAAFSSASTPVYTYLQRYWRLSAISRGIFIAFRYFYASGR